MTGILLDIRAPLYTFSLPTGENGVIGTDAGERAGGRKVGVSTSFHSVISAMTEPAVPEDKCWGASVGSSTVSVSEQSA